MNIDDLPDEPFPHEICSKLICLNFKYSRNITIAYNQWNNINPKLQLNFIQKINKKYKHELELEWINTHIDTDFDDY